MKIENSFFFITLSDELILTLEEKKNGTQWRSDSPFKLNYGHCWEMELPSHAEHTVKEEGSRIHIFFRNLNCYARFPENPYKHPAAVPDFEFHFIIGLEEDRVVFTTGAIRNLADEEIVLTFPDKLLRFPSTEKISCPIPSGYGALLRFPESAQDTFTIRNFMMTNMAFFGILPEKESGLAVYMKDFCDMTMRADINRTPGEFSFTPSYTFNSTVSNYPRELHLRAMAPGSDYNDLAKWYRSVVKNEGRFVTLKEKIRKDPEVEKLVGAVIWKHDVFARKEARPEHAYSYFIMQKPETEPAEGKAANWNAYELFDTAKASGFDRVCVYNTGWNRGGYDGMYPTRFPPNPERGTEEDFREAARYARTLSDGYIFSVHDNYIEVYASSPEFDREKLVHDEMGGIVRGSIWRGGRAYALSSDIAVSYAERDLPRIAGMLGRGSIYIDVLGCVPPFSNFSEGHIYGERTDLENRRKIIEIAKREFGSFSTEQDPNEFCADIVDLGAFSWFGGAWLSKIPLLPIPLWQLVYHDSVLNYTADSTIFGCRPGEYHALTALYCLLPTAFDEKSREQSFKLRPAFVSEMLSHEFLTEPVFGEDKVLHAVMRTCFADGTEVVANLNCEPYFFHGEEIKENGYRIFSGNV